MLTMVFDLILASTEIGVAITLPRDLAPRCATAVPADTDRRPLSPGLLLVPYYALFIPFSHTLYRSIFSLGVEFIAIFPPVWEMTLTVKSGAPSHMILI